MNCMNSLLFLRDALIFKSNCNVFFAKFGYILQNFGKFRVGPKIFVSTNFSVFSSRNGRTGWDINYFLFSKFFRIFFWGRKFETKVDFSDFASTNSIEIFVISWKFCGFGARIGCILPFCEERIEIGVDTAEKWGFENCENFCSISNKETRATCLEHNFSKSGILIDSSEISSILGLKCRMFFFQVDRFELVVYPKERDPSSASYSSLW